MAVLAPIPRASAARAATVTPGLPRKTRSACRKSWSTLAALHATCQIKWLRLQRRLEHDCPFMGSASVLHLFKFFAAREDFTALVERASKPAPILVAAPPLCGAGNSARSRLLPATAALRSGRE